MSSLAQRVADALVKVVPGNLEAVDALRPLYDPAMIFQDPIQRLEGVERFLEMNHHLLHRMRKLEWEILGQGGDDDNAFVEWTMKCSPKIGPAIEVSGVTRVRARGGKIVDHRDYWDVGELIASAMPGGIKVLHLFRKPLA
ncbi:MAG: nuclear transport factor 2 family protein [Polyangiaceae bacterium]